MPGRAVNSEPHSPDGKLQKVYHNSLSVAGHKPQHSDGVSHPLRRSKLNAMTALQKKARLTQLRQEVVFVLDHQHTGRCKTLASKVIKWTQLLAMAIKLHGPYDTNGKKADESLTGHLLSVGAGRGRDVGVLLPMFAGVIVTIDKNVSPSLQEFRELRGRMTNLTMDVLTGDWCFPQQKLEGLIFELTTMIFTANMLQEHELQHLMQKLDGHMTYVLVIDSFTDGESTKCPDTDGLVRRTKEEFIELASSNNLELVVERQLFEGDCTHSQCECVNAFDETYVPVHALVFLHRNSGLKMQPLDQGWTGRFLRFFREDKILKEDLIFHSRPEHFRYLAPYEPSQ